MYTKTLLKDLQQRIEDRIKPYEFKSGNSIIYAWDHETDEPSVASIIGWLPRLYPDDFYWDLNVFGPGVFSYHTADDVGLEDISKHLQLSLFDAMNLFQGYCGNGKGYVAILGELLNFWTGEIEIVSDKSKANSRWFMEAYVNFKINETQVIDASKLSSKLLKS